jgi:hypothetical protein
MYFVIYGTLGAVLTALALTLSNVTRSHTIGWSIFLGLLVGGIGWLAMPVFAWDFYGNWVLRFLPETSG